jgi:hypothetical protein
MIWAHDVGKVRIGDGIRRLHTRCTVLLEFGWRIVTFSNLLEGLDHGLDCAIGGEVGDCPVEGANWAELSLLCAVCEGK